MLPFIINHLSSNIAYVHNKRIYRSILPLIDIQNQITAFVMKQCTANIIDRNRKDA